MGKLTSTVTPQGLVGVVPHVDVGLEALPSTGCVAGFVCFCTENLKHASPAPSRFFMSARR